MSDKQFVEILENLKEDLYGKTLQDTKAQEKFDSEKWKLVKMITCELKKVEEIFENTGIPEEIPNVVFNYQRGIALTFPIVRHSTRYIFNMNFDLMLTEEGYGIHIKWLGFDKFLNPPVEIEQIREKILEYLEERRKRIRKIESKYENS
jgi:hypothetical protein